MLKNAPIQDMLAIGAVTPRSARIWARASRPGRYTLAWSRSSNGPEATAHLDLDDPARDLTGSLTIRALIPNTRYQVALDAQTGERLATGSFTSAPADARSAPPRYSIALMSCHQPFAPDGEVAPTTQAMLTAVHQVLLQHETRLVVMCGDQLYSDYPRNASLMDPRHFAEVAPPGRSTLLECGASEIRRLFQQRYRHFWNIRGWQQLLANYPCYPILDDHEIVDNWGSAQEHGEAKWQAFRHGAFQAYADYQGSRVCAAHVDVPPCFDYEIVFADVALYVMDLRSNRRVGNEPRLVSPSQLDAFSGFLERHRDKSALFVVLSVPLLHLPPALARLAAKMTPDGEDFSDRWSSRGHCRDRDQILRLLRAHKRRNAEQPLVLLSGDIHIGCLHEVAWRDRCPGFYQFISSGVTHDAGRLIRNVSGAIIRAHHRARVEDDEAGELTARLRLVPGERGARRNPCGSLNVGIIEIERRAPESPTTLRFLLYSHEGSRPRCRYRSARIAAGVD